MTLSVPITPKMGEAIMWGLAQIGDQPRRTAEHPSDPLFILLQRWPRREIMKTCAGMWQMAYGDVIREPLTDLQKDILRCCVENTTWLESYVHNELIGPSSLLVGEAKAALRELAAALEALGIDVNDISTV